MLLLLQDMLDDELKFVFYSKKMDKVYEVASN
jgi:hypothetical protein